MTVQEFINQVGELKQGDQPNIMDMVIQVSISPDTSGVTYEADVATISADADGNTLTICGETPNK